MNNIANGWIWLGFSIFLIIALSADTFILDKKSIRPHQSIRVALLWTIFWVMLAFIFNGLLWVYLYITTDAFIAHESALAFLTGYLIEKTLSLDNLFVFVVIFKHLQIPYDSQQRVFSLGIWGAIVMRLVLILLGTWAVARFHWILYVLGAFLLLTGIKMLVLQEKKVEKDLTETVIIKCLRRVFRLTPQFDGDQFFIKKNGIWYATPLLVALVLIEFSDLIFAIDSVPAIFAITQDPFIVWSSNIFAILGLRAMYFILSGVLLRFHFVKYGIALILVYVGSKMVVDPWIHIPIGISLGVIAAILLIFVVISFLLKRQQGS